MQLDYDLIMTADQAGALLAVSPKTLYNLERHAGLPVHRLGGRGDRRYIVAEVLAWLATQPATRTTELAS